MDKNVEYWAAMTKHLDSRLEWDNQHIGLLRMQSVVLKWLLEHRRDVPELLRQSLIRTTQGAIDASVAVQPSLTPPGLEGTCSAE